MPMGSKKQQAMTGVPVRALTAMSVFEKNISYCSSQEQVSGPTSSGTEDERARDNVNADHRVKGEEEMAGDSVASLYYL